MKHYLSIKYKTTDQCVVIVIQILTYHGGRTSGIFVFQRWDQVSKQCNKKLYCLENRTYSLILFSLSFLLVKCQGSALYSRIKNMHFILMYSRCIYLFDSQCSRVLKRKEKISDEVVWQTPLNDISSKQHNTHKKIFHFIWLDSFPLLSQRTRTRHYFPINPNWQ